MSQSMIDLVTHVVTRARSVGLDQQDQRDAAVAALMAAMPHETPTIARFMVDLVLPTLAEA
ncbi:hypothetical protein [Paramagnetospirillum marisnigri]|uniref:hypothetical protein n=1 Tax=Paramagnetospirillum marisnigri TaxID=1285242 RepID=UPI0012E70398|nr:hypothetical protein [Paramagnetospirillum marisnigri]